MDTLAGLLPDGVTAALIGPEAAGELHRLTLAAFSAYAGRLDPPTGALAETVADLERDLDAHPGVLLRDPAGTAIAGLRLQRDLDGRSVLARRVAVDPTRQRQGLGVALMRWIAGYAHATGAVVTRVGVRHDLPTNLAFYRRLGYTPVIDHGFWLELARPAPHVEALGSSADTRALGARLASAVVAGDLLVLAGPVGAGKTVFVQGLAAGLGVAGQVTSPSFVLARAHRALAGGLGLVHADLWRLDAVADPWAEVDALGLDADLDDAVLAVEWGAGLVEPLAADYLLVELNRPVGTSREEGSRRTVSITPYGERLTVALEALSLSATRPAGVHTGA